jgi:pyridoxamine 5'-phosphate oxidase
MVLLTGVGEDGFTFYTNFKSQKSRSLTADPRAALTVYWEKFRRQVRIQGTTEPVSDAEADAYFKTRSRDSQLGAWASAQSQPLADRETLERRFEEYDEKFADQEVPRPPFWSGYRLRPETIEFWIERPHRLHDRFLYTQKGERWEMARLYP